MCRGDFMKKSILFALLAILAVAVSGCTGTTSPQSEDTNTDDQNSGKLCIQVITPATNDATGECKEYPTPCDVPAGWTKTGSCDVSPQSGQTQTQAGIPAAGEPPGPTKLFTMTAKQFSFEPGTVTVNKNDHVILKITSTDTTHGFSLPDFNVNVNIPPGETVLVEFDATKTGTFTYVCSVFCGSGHGQMKGLLVVQ